MRLVNWRTLIAGAASIALAACGDDVTVVQPVPTITPNPASVTCAAGTTTAVGITVGGATGTPQVTFTPSGSGFTVAGSGTGATVTCSSVGAGVINVSVTANGQTVTTSIPVTVTPAAPQVLGISVSPNQATIAVGGSVTLTPTVITAPGAPASASAVTYTSLQTNIATVDANGVVRGVAPGIATIRVASTASPNLVATATITVQSAAAFVQSLVVQPTTVTLQTGATQTLASTVTLAPGAPAGTSTGVTYTSSDTSVVTVSSTGVITARRNGTAVITVASQAAPSVTQAVSVTVRDPAPVRLTIQSVRQVNAAGNFVPVDPSQPTGGTLTATLNLDPGDFRPDSVRLRLGNLIVNCQRFPAALADAYRAALTDGSADVQQIECPINSAQFDTLTGAVRVQNGQQPLTAEVFFRPQGAAAGTQQQQAQISQNYIIQNVSGFWAQVTNVLPQGDARAAVNATGRALGPDGRTWIAGDIQVRLLPVLFQPGGATGPLQTVSVTLTDPNLPGGSATQVANAAGNTGSTTLTFPGASADTPQGNNSVSGFTSSAGGTVVTLGAVGGNAGTAFLTQSGTPVPGAFTINIDNQTPEARTITVPTQFTQGNLGNVGFLGGGFSFTDSLTVSAATTVNGDNGGVNRVSFTFFVDTAGEANSAIISGGVRAARSSDLTAFSGVAITNTFLRAVAVLRDALGNSRNTSVLNTAGNANFTFGVDLVAPSITGGTSGTIDRSGALAVTRTATFSVSDDVSGFNTLPLVARITRQDPVNGIVCITSAPNGLADVTSTTQAIPSNGIAGCPLVALPGTFGVAGTAPDGEYRFDVAARDVAGNLSSFSTRRWVFDRGVPTVGGISLPATLGNNAVATFTSSATDAFELQSAYGVVSYGGTGVALRYDGPTLGTSFDNVFTTSAPVAITTTNGFIRQIQQGTLTQSAGVGATTGTVFGAGTGTIAAAAFGVIAIDAGNNRALSAVAIPAANLGTDRPGSLGTGSTAAIDSVQVRFIDPAGNASGSVVGGVVTDTLSTTGTTGQFGALNPTSVTVRFDVFGPSGTFNIPFQRVELWTIAPNSFFSGNAAAARAAFNPAQPLTAPFTSTVYRFFQSFSGAPSITDLGGTVRRIRYQTTVTAASLDPGSNSSGEGQFVVIGVTSGGDAIVSAPVAIRVNNP